MALERLVSVLWCTDGAGKAGLQELEERCAQLEEQLDQEPQKMNADSQP